MNAMIEKAGSTKMGRRILAGGVALLSSVALAGAAEVSAAGADDTIPAVTPQEQVQECNYQAYYVFGGSSMNYIRRHGFNNLYVRENVSGRAAEACDNVADVKVTTQEYIGVDENHLHPNTTEVTVHDGTDAFQASVVQRGARLFHNGRQLEQVVRINVTPYDGEQPTQYDFPSCIEPISTTVSQCVQ